MRGKIIYTTFCIGCHGIAGKVMAIFIQVVYILLNPVHLSGETAVKLRDGEIYHTITLGIWFNGSHGSQIRPDDRWKIVLYIRKLQEEAKARY